MWVSVPGDPLPGRGCAVPLAVLALSPATGLLLHHASELSSRC